VASFATVDAELIDQIGETMVGLLTVEAGGDKVRATALWGHLVAVLFANELAFDDAAAPEIAARLNSLLSTAGVAYRLRLPAARARHDG
jgi:hypothetical protein